MRFSYAFPFTPMGPKEDVFVLLRNHLPPWEIAVSICETYLENASWLFRSVSRQQLMEEMLPAIYKKRPVVSPDDYDGAHGLALLFSIFSVGRIVDISISHTAAEQEGEHFNQLAMAALCLQPLLEKPSLVTIQSLHVASIYNAMCGCEVSSGESSMETTWSLIAVASYLAQTVSFTIILSSYTLLTFLVDWLTSVGYLRPISVNANDALLLQIETVLGGSLRLRWSKDVGCYSGIYSSPMLGMYVLRLSSIDYVNL